MKAVKIIVAVMSVLIVIGLGLVGYGVMGTMSPEKPLAERGQAFGPVALDQPEGSRIRSMTAADGRLLLHIEGGGQPERVVVVDMAGGAVLGKLVLETQKP